MLKSEIRIQFKEKRKSLSTEEKENYSKKIAETVSGHFDLNNKYVSIFLPIERLNEVNTSFLFKHLRKVNSTISMPKSDFDSLELRHVIHTEKTILKENKWGIPEPLNGDELKPELLDVVFVPLLASDNKGYRVGYGKGFYDRFLSQCRKDAIFIGLNYFESLVEIDDINSDDIPIHFLVTPCQVVAF